ncbi:hypothetical protein VZT92_011466 [Zoarces viviparus]|uniref:Uncharacterized protein n=1 Tax=Zoarces viviparus TaxID=48416 RepID=A0AAW1F6R6_ZOAVI
MMYETAAPLEYHRNTTAEQQHCPIMETDGTAPALVTLSTTKIELAQHSRLLRGPWTSSERGPRKRVLNLTAAHVCRPRWVPPRPDRWMDGWVTYGWTGTCTGLCGLGDSGGEVRGIPGPLVPVRHS